MRWRVREGETGAAQGMMEALRISGPTARVLTSRGFTDTESARIFLEPNLTDLHDPFLLEGMEEATRCISEAVREKRGIVVFGDYDADGICGSSILSRILEILGGQVQVMLPNRLRDGYSLNADAVRRIQQSGARVAITVDNGISANAEAEALASAGIDLVIVDHHEAGASIPQARAILNPKLPGTGYPFRDLCATGVAFKLAWALGQRFPKVSEEVRSILLDSLAAVALATVADVSPLLGENRVLVTFGLRALRASRNPGIRALLEKAGTRGDSLTARDIAFRLAPMINAPGRLGEASLSLDLLVSQSDEEAAGIVREMSRANRKRQAIQKSVLAAARVHMREELEIGRSALVLASEEWHPGVTGIVAGQLTRESGLPTILITLEEKTGRGSARSVPGFSLPDALDGCDDLLVSHGGHARAAGLVIERANLNAFRERFCELIRSRGQEAPEKVLEVDAEVDLEDLKPRTVNELARLAPFGEGNPRPILLARRCRIAGAIRHRRRGVSFFIRQDDVALRANLRNGTDLPERSDGKPNLPVAFWPEIGRTGEVDLDVVDFPEGPR